MKQKPVKNKTLLEMIDDIEPDDLDQFDLPAAALAICKTLVKKGWRKKKK